MFFVSFGFMLYIISGASRAGKTLLAQKLATKKEISYFSLDWLVMGFTNGMPETGIHDLLFPDEIAERSWPFFKAMFKSMLYNDIDYIIEGEAILPELILELMAEHPNQIKTCFLGFTMVEAKEKVTEIKKFRLAEKDWLCEKSDEYILDHVHNMIGHSLKITASCEEHKLPYFDTSSNFLDTINQAAEYLLE